MIVAAVCRQLSVISRRPRIAHNSGAIIIMVRGVGGGERGEGRRERVVMFKVVHVSAPILNQYKHVVAFR